MVTSGAAWLLSLGFSITNPEIRLNLDWNPGSILLSKPALIFDGISIPLALSLAGIILYTALSQRFSTPQLAWISTLGGICYLTVNSDNVYTFLLFWTLIEIYLITYSVLNQGVTERDFQLILPIVVRLGTPLLLIYAAMIGMEEGINAHFSGFNTAAGPILLLAGGFGLIVLFLGAEITTFDGEREDLERILRLLPAAISIMLITRGAELMDPILVQPGLKIIIAIPSMLLGFFSIISTSRELSIKIWSYGVVGLIIASALISSSSSFSWGMVLLLPGALIYQSYKSKSLLIVALIIATIGTIPLPFLPAWNGSGLFTHGVSGVMFAIAAGTLFGGIFSKNLSLINEEEKPSVPVPLLYILSPIILLITQVLIALEYNLLDSSKKFLSLPILVWIPVFLIVLIYIFGERIPVVNLFRIQENIQITRRLISLFASGTARIVNQAVVLITNLFEGEGGLIWALLIGFLLVTLITLSGGY
jgi:hypothetical protein